MSNASLVAVRDWRPDRRVSLSLALVSALLAVCGFVLLLRQPALTHSQAAAISIRPHAALPNRQPALRVLRSRSGVISKLITVKPLRPIPSAPPDLASRLDLNIPAPAPGSPSFLPESVQPMDRNLAQALNAPLSPWSDLKEGHGFTGEHGQTIIKSGSVCISMQTIQMSPSPTNKATIGFLVPCPGEYQPTLGERLLDWAEKHAAAQPPP